MTETTYDSAPETLEHIDRVKHYMSEMVTDLFLRINKHDASKLEAPEKEYFDKYTPRLATLTFGSPEYTQNIQDLKPALEHHYAVNDHHPQFHGEDGINGMNLLSLVEMLADWKAAGERGKGGNIYKSIDINAERFGISKQLKKILINTAKYLGYE
jgi:hypothetical protein